MKRVLCVGAAVLCVLTYIVGIIPFALWPY